MVLVWLAVLIALAGSTVLATADYILGSSALMTGALWALRILGLAACWLLPARRDARGFGMALIALWLVLDVLLKLPVLGSVEYGDWFLVSALDLAGTYSGYFTFWGLALPVVGLTGWFVLRGRTLAGWITGLVLVPVMSLALQALAGSENGSLASFALLSIARLIIPALVSAGVDVLSARISARKNA